VRESEPQWVGLVRFGVGGRAGGLPCSIAEQDDVEEWVSGSGGLACRAGSRVGCVWSWRTGAGIGGEAGCSRAPRRCAGEDRAGAARGAGSAEAGGGGVGGVGGGWWGSKGLCGGAQVVEVGLPVACVCSWWSAVRYDCCRVDQVSADMVMRGRGGDTVRVLLVLARWSISVSLIRKRAWGLQRKAAR
jgi:hypothetical protein